MYHNCCMLVLLFCLPLLAVSAMGSELDSVVIATDSTLESLQKTTWVESNYVKQSLVPAVLVTSSLGIMAVPDLKYRIQEQLNWNASEQVNLFDDELRFVPMGAVALLSITGLKGKHQLLEEVVLGGVAYIFADFIVYRTKQATQVTRPNPEYGTTSFPSQHASMAFVGATLLHREFGYLSPWISVGGFGMATWVAYARIARNRHFLPDVLMGSAVGIMATNATYWVYDALAPKLKNRLRCSPRLTDNGGELFLSYQF
ncbi:MAG: phosphatase PAP2 family protein [Bacteroidia bacterium]|nr:phosphatase PAP2 family protein [Bacteroidia bacterium]